MLPLNMEASEYQQLMRGRIEAKQAKPTGLIVVDELKVKRDRLAQQQLQASKVQ
jgi:hypothetical protein